MNPAVQSALVTGLLGVVIIFISTRANRRSQDADNAIKGKAVDLSVLTESIDELKSSNVDVKDRLKAVETELQTEREARVIAMNRAEKAEKRALAAEARADAAEERITRLTTRVAQLEDVLRRHDIAVPPVP